MQYRAEEIAHDLEPNALARGRGYQRQGRVLEYEWVDDDFLVASVSGSDPEPYHCSIELSRDRRGRLQIDGACSCPVGFNCKHVAAALLEAAADNRPRAAEDSPQLQHWLQTIESALTDPNEYPAEIKERLLYILDLRRYHTGVTQLLVKPMKTRLLKTGGYGASRAYNSFGTAKFLRPVDVRLLNRLNHQSQYSLDLRLEGDEGARLLEEMLATGRCHWQQQDNPPLQLGPPRPGEFAWVADSDGRQQLRLQSDTETAILPLTPPWYLDLEANRCGPLQTALPERLAAALVQAPPLPPEVAENVSAKLLRLGSKLPLPSRLPRRERDDVVPVPCLNLVSADLGDLMRQRLGLPFQYGPAMPRVRQDQARLSFDYAGLRAAADDPAAAAAGQRDGVLWSIARDKNAEAAAAERLRELGFQRTESGLALPDEEAWLQFMVRDLPELRAQGWQVEIAHDFSVRLAEPGEWYGELEEQGNDWFGLSLGVTVDGEQLNLLPLLAQLIRQLPRADQLDALPEDQLLMLRLDDGRLLPLPVARLRPILRTLLELYDPKALDPDGKLRLSRLQSPALSDLEAGGALAWSGGENVRRLGERLKGFKGIDPVQPPQGLQATLRDYQQQGLAWLQFLREYELGGVLADDMGLGKTVQTLAHLLLEKESGRADRPSLVIAPTSLLTNWRREAERFAPDLKVLTLHGPQREADFGAIAEHDLVLTTYPLLPRDADALLARDYHLLILDEAQQIKNPRAKASEIARQLKARHRLCLSGTPLENNLGELWSLFHFLMPGLLGERERFSRLFRTPIEKQNDDERRQQLRARVAPFLLRRTKEAVAAELPAKTELVRTVALEGAQRDLYEAVRLSMHERLRKEIDQKGWERSQIVVLDALLKLRQICCDPRLVKLSAGGRVKRSAKLELLLNMLPEMVAEGRRILLFSQFTSMLALIEEALAPLGIPYVKLTGDTRDRATPIERFQNGEVPLFLISLKAGGVGLNLTAADTVIHYDPWWNPAVERQATDRAHRIGQDKPVFVYKLIAEGTLEEKMAELQARKQGLSDSVLGAEGTAGGRLTAEDLENILAPL
jgi:superfamily II DNA or RNA helicase